MGNTRIRPHASIICLTLRVHRRTQRHVLGPHNKILAIGHPGFPPRQSGGVAWRQRVGEDGADIGKQRRITPQTSSPRPRIYRTSPSLVPSYHHVEPFPCSSLGRRTRHILWLQTSRRDHGYYLAVLQRETTCLTLGRVCYILHYTAQC